MKELGIILTMAAVTALLRFTPFIVFRRRTPAYIAYLGRVLPPALIGMLVIYCFKDVRFASAPYGLPELIAAVCIVLLQLWKRSSLVSILGGTAIYMALVQLVFH